MENHIPKNSDISKQLIKNSNTIKRLANQLSKMHPELIDKFDKILYAALKIEKIGKKIEGICRCSLISLNYGQEIPKDYDDEFYTQAANSIKRLCASTSKLERKVNIILSEAHFYPSKKTKSIINKQNREEQVHKKRPIKHKSTKMVKEQIFEQIPENHEEEDEVDEVGEVGEQNSDISLHALDEQIRFLTLRLRKQEAQRVYAQHDEEEDNQR